MKKITVILLTMVLLMGLSAPAFAAEANLFYLCPNCNKVTLAGTITHCASCGAKLLPVAGGGESRGANAGRRADSVETAKQYYTAPTATSNGAYSGGSTAYYSVVDASSKTLNYTTYSTTNNNYTTHNYTYNNYTYNNEYNYYTYNVENKNYYVTNNYTYVTVLAPDGTTDANGNDNYEEINIYYQLPDGRNSYNLTVDEVKGTYLNYNVTGCEKVLEDDGVTLGLWHLDGDFQDSSANAGQYALTSNFTNFVDSSNLFGLGLASPGYALGTSGVLCEMFSLEPKLAVPYTVEFRIYVASSSSDNVRCFFYNTNNCTYLEVNQWNVLAITYDGSTMTTFVNGVEKKTFTGTITNFICKLVINANSQTTVILDEVRLSAGILYTANYQYSLQPFDTNSVLVKPTSPLANDIAIMSNIPVTNYRIGGVRPTYPVKGDVFISFDDKQKVDAIQQYQGDGWFAVDAVIYYDGVWQNLKNFDLGKMQFGEPLDTTTDPTPTPTPTPTPGTDPTPTPGGDGEDDTDNWFTKLLKSIVNGVVKILDTIVGGVVDLVVGLIDKLVDGVTYVIDKLFGAFGKIADFGGDFKNFLGGVFTFLPSELTILLSLSVSLAIVFAIIKFIRG